MKVTFWGLDAHRIHFLPSPLYLLGLCGDYDAVYKMITLYEFILRFLMWFATWVWIPIGVDTATSDSLRVLV